MGRVLHPQAVALRRLAASAAQRARPFSGRLYAERDAPAERFSNAASGQGIDSGNGGVCAGSVATPVPRCTLRRPGRAGHSVAQTKGPQPKLEAFASFAGRAADLPASPVPVATGELCQAV